MLALAAALAGGLLGTLLVRTVAVGIGFVNQPNRIVPQHTTAVAYGGGLGVYLGMLAGLLVVRSDAMLLLPAGLAAVLGLVDDKVGLRPSTKLVGQAAVAAVLVAVLPVPEMVGAPGVDMLGMGLVAVVLMNAANLTDVCDGLVGGLGALAVGAMALTTRSIPLGVGAAALVGFLAFNRPPASIFLGDAGSHLVGLLLAAGTSLLMVQRGALGGGAIAILCAGVFIFELVFLIVIRTRKGRRFWAGSPDHFSLRLQAGPFSRWQTVLIAWSAGGLGAAAALVAAHSRAWVGVAALAVSVIGALVAARVLMRWDAE